MRRFLIVLLLVAFAGNTTIYAQANTGKKLEREVKTSGDYYYGEGVDADQNRSKQSALDDLKLMILEAAMSSNTTLMTADFNGFDENLATEIFDLKGRIKVLMYVLKSDVSFEKINDRKVLISYNANMGSQAESPSEPKVVADEQPIEVPASSQNKVAEDPKIITVTTTKPDLQPSQAEPAQQTSTTPNSQTTPSSSTSRATPPSQGASSASSSTPRATRPDTKQATKTSEPIINQLLSIKQYEEARQILNKYKLDGKLMYGQLATLSNPQNCYFLVLRNREIVDVLDKSDRSERRSLITGNVMDYKTTTGVVLWICIL